MYKKKQCTKLFRTATYQYIVSMTPTASKMNLQKQKKKKKTGGLSKKKKNEIKITSKRNLCA